MLYDAHLKYTRSGSEVFLRIANFTPSGDFIEVGVPYTPTGTDAVSTGYVDLLIDPPPATQAVSYHDIAMSGAKLMFGARRFFVSDTFVSTLIDQYPSIRGKYHVFRQWDGTAYVIGLVYNNQLYSIEDIGRKEIAGRTINWILTCNSQEEYIDERVSEQLQP